MSTKKQGQTRFDEFDRRMMARAIALARRGEGYVEPNPMVGCVIVGKRGVIAEGHHLRFGGPHAEIEALRACSSAARGATVYVSLEPCCHFGKTPPCCDALVKAKVARVVVAVRDPNPTVRGRGIRSLRSAGITVETGLLRQEASALLAPYTARIRLGRPYVIAKWAQSLDGKLATQAGDSQWISCEASRRQVHRLRARVDAILVGSGTVLADDPQLTARGVRIKRRAMRVVLDSRLRVPLSCRLVVSAKNTPTLVLTTRSRAGTPKAVRLRKHKVEVVACRSRNGRMTLNDCLETLAKRDVTNLLVEGGPTILTALLLSQNVDEAFVFVAPMLIGGTRAPSVIGQSGAARIEAAITPTSVQTGRSGNDTFYRIRLT